MALLPPDPVFCFRSDMGYIHSLCFSVKSDNYVSQLLAASEKGIVYFWNLETNRMQYKQEMGESIQAIHSHEDTVITQEKSGAIKLWTINNGTYEISESYECSGGYCKCIVISDKLIVPQEEGRVDILNIRTLKKLKSLTPNEEQIGQIMCLTKAAVDTRVFIIGGYETGDVVLWDLEMFEQCGHIKLQEQITSLTYDPVTSRGVCGNTSNILQIFQINKSLNITLKCEISLTNEGCNIVKIRPDHKILVSGGWDGRIRLFSWKTLRLLVVLREHKDSITDVQFSPNAVKYWNSNIMAVSSADGTISLWNLYNQ